MLGVTLKTRAAETNQEHSQNHSTPYTFIVEACKSTEKDARFASISKICS